MTLALPAHLQGRASPNIVEQASAGIGGSVPPHVSIRGNCFTLVDAGGNEAPFPVGAPLDIVIAASSGTPPPKRYYDKPWTPDSNEPPTCWSINGVVPDAGATEKQARTCAECPKNERGSAVSKISGAAIKACRDEKWLAVLLPAYPNMMFQLVITPGSFKNWQAYTKNFGNGVDLCDVITRITFQPQVNGVLVFEILGYAQNSPQYVSADIRGVLEAAWAEKKTDVLVGKSDQPIALPAPSQQTVAGPGYETAPVHLTTGGPGATQPVPFVPAQFAPNVAAPQAPAFQTPATASPSEQPQRRRRRTAAEMAAAQAPQGPQGGAGTPPMQAPFAPQQFQPAPAASAGNGATFGMQAGAAPNADLTKTLEGLFGKK